MDDLPTEILVHIFSMGCQESWTHQTRTPYPALSKEKSEPPGPFSLPYTPHPRAPKAFARRIASVCATWRDIVEGTPRLHLARLELNAKLSYNLIEQDISVELTAFEHSLRTSRGCDLDVLLYWGSDASERESRLFLWGMKMLVNYRQQWRCVSASFSHPLSPISALSSAFLSKAEDLVWFCVHLPTQGYPPPTPPSIDLYLHDGTQELDCNPFEGLKSVAHLEGNLRRLSKTDRLAEGCVRTISVSDAYGSCWADFIKVLKLCSRATFITLSSDGLTELPHLDSIPKSAVSYLSHRP